MQTKKFRKVDLDLKNVTSNKSKESRRKEIEINKIENQKIVNQQKFASLKENIMIKLIKEKEDTKSLCQE